MKKPAINPGLLRIRAELAVTQERFTAAAAAAKDAHTVSRESAWDLMTAQAAARDEVTRLRMIIACRAWDN